MMKTKIANIQPSWLRRRVRVAAFFTRLAHIVCLAPFVLLGLMLCSVAYLFLGKQGWEMVMDAILNDSPNL